MMQMRDLSGIAQFLDGIFGVALRSAFFAFVDTQTQRSRYYKKNVKKLQFIHKLKAVAKRPRVASCY